jgi:tRNA-uridine 2-sulfurtransferase
MSTEKLRVVVAMSGGVDSSVAAALLVEQGHDVIGVMMKLWSEPGTAANACCTPDAIALARDIAAQLEIPFHTVDSVTAFRENVVQFFIDSYKIGATPNPCVACNKIMRWNTILDQADALEASHVATGHYARLRKDQNGITQLLRGVDQHKDQSYVLHGLTQNKLARTIFPLGDYTKPEIREMAHKYQLPSAARPDSQDLCFVGNGDYRDFLVRNAPETSSPGPIIDSTGRERGQHQGLAFHTIGQRKGLGIAAAEPLYVLEKDVRQNTIVVGTAAEMGRSELTASQVNWISSQPPQEPILAGVKIRYKSRNEAAVITPLDEKRVQIKFETPIRDITAGQAAVFYDGEVCLGGGIIQ